MTKTIPKAKKQKANRTFFVEKLSKNFREPIECNCRLTGSRERSDFDKKFFFKSFVIKKNNNK